MELFDHFERNDSSPKRHTESAYAFMNRSAQEWSEKQRNIFQDWFSRYPTKDKADLAGRFKSKWENQHNPAIFELFLHELLLKLGYEVEIHPELEGSTNKPDFLVKSNGHESFYLEAVVAIELSQDEISARNRRNVVFDLINQIDTSYFYLRLREFGEAQSQPPAKEFKKEIEKWLKKLDHKELYKLSQTKGLKSMPVKALDCEGWKIEISPIPKKPEKWGIPGGRAIQIQLGGARWISPGEYLKRAIVKKSSRYGKFNVPFIIAVNPSDFHMDYDDAIDALFGSIGVQFVPEDLEHEATEIRNPNGVWTSEKGPINSNINAVLIVSKIFIPNLSKTEICLYHNPSVVKSDGSLLTKLKQGRVVDNEMQYSKGEKLESVLGVIPFL